MTEPSALVRAFNLQADACDVFGSPFSAALLRLAVQTSLADGPLARLLSPWSQRSTRDLMAAAVPLRWLGCLHDLVLAEASPALGAAYPTPVRIGDADAAWAAADAAMTALPERFAAFLDHEPQTNEVRRSACLLPGFLTLAAETRLPLRLFEIGASAGLNQFWDRFHYDLGACGAWGDAGASVRLETRWTGPPPPLDAPVAVVSRAACDRKPVDIRDSIARRRLKAFVWPDQFDRLARLDAALAVALEAGATVKSEDAVTWTARRAAPQAGTATVVYHSVFWQYLPAETQEALGRVIADLGARATADGPFAWLRMEPSPRSLADMELRLTLWPGGEERRLASVHPHGASVDWTP
jgi:hypothetical protein